MTTWKPCPTNHRYHVSDRGDVRGPRSTLAPWTDRDGYKRVRLYHQGGHRTAGVHQLVLEAFAGMCPAGHSASHVDGDPGNNNIDNLRWETVSQNNLRRTAHGKLPLGSKIAVSKLTECDVREIRRRYTGEWGQLTQLGREFGCSRVNIKNIVTRKWWRHVQ